MARTAANGAAIASVRNPLRLDRYSEPVPDLKLLRSRCDFYRDSQSSAADVPFLVKVAENSLDYDRGAKLTLYARHGVPEVWVVDLVGRAVEICPEPGTEGGGLGAVRYAKRVSSVGCPQNPKSPQTLDSIH